MKHIKQLLILMLLIFSVFGIVGCDEISSGGGPIKTGDEEETIAPSVTNIRINYNVVTWDDAENATSYELIITINNVVSEYTVYNNSYNFQSIMSSDVEEIEFKVITLPGIAYDKESLPVTYTYKKTQTETIKRAPVPTGLTHVDKLFKWNPVLNCTSYKVTVTIDGVTNTYTVNTNSFDFASLITTTTKRVNFSIIALKGSEYDYDSLSATYAVSITSDDGDDIDITDKEYYASIKTFTGNALKLELRTLITNTHKKRTSYDDCKQNLPNTDQDPLKSSNMILFYTDQSITKTTNMDIWNREHVWPKSLGWFTTSGAGADLHHLRPCDPDVNEARGNKKFGNNSPYYIPKDNYKGDCARIIFYLMTRYSESDSYSFTSVAQSKDVLLAWNELDPVSTLEINRNEAIYKIQGNRNPYIDCPEFADMIWGNK